MERKRLCREHCQGPGLTVHVAAEQAAVLAETDLSCLSCYDSRKPLNHILAAVLLQGINLTSQVSLDDNWHIHLQVVQELDHVKVGIS